MKLALIEPFVISKIVLLPHLGCSTLLSCCNEQNHETTLLPGQVVFRKEFFENDAEEFYGHIHDHRFSHIVSKYLKDEVLNISREELIDEFTFIANHLYPKKNIGKFLNPTYYEQYSKFLITALNIYNEILAEHQIAIGLTQRYVKKLLDIQPDVVGFSVQGGLNKLTECLINQIRSKIDVPLIIGGAQTPYWDHDELFTIFETLPINCILIGQADETLPLLLNHMEEHQDLSKIPNLVTKEQGTVRFTYHSSIINLDNLPFPDYSQYDFDLFGLPTTVLPIQTSRGCSWNHCTFCSHQLFASPGYQEISIDRVIGTLEYLKTHHKVNHFIFNDAEISAKRIGLLSDKIINNNELQNIHLSCYARFEENFLEIESIFDQAKKAGFQAISWGLESGVDRIRNLMGKGVAKTIVQKTQKKSSSVGISNFCFVMVGFPSKTANEAEETWRFIKNNAENIDLILMNIFGLDRYSRIGKNPKQWGIKSAEYKPNTYIAPSYECMTGITTLEANAIQSKWEKI